MGINNTNSSRDINIQPTVIPLDSQLPEVHGLEVLRRINSDKQLQFIPVVILTSSKEEFDMVQGYSLGANSLILKSVDFLQFNEAVKTLTFTG
jgi:CheY-like chemotaxis protein